MGSMNRCHLRLGLTNETPDGRDTPEGREPSRAHRLWR